MPPGRNTMQTKRQLIDEIKKYPGFFTGSTDAEIILEALENFLGEVKDAKETMEEFRGMDDGN